MPVQPELPPLPELVEMCISKAVVLPAQITGKSWDGVGKIRRKDAKMIGDIAAAASGGGYTAAVAAAGTVGAAIFNKVKGPPDLRVRVQLGREYIIRTDMVKDTAIAAFGANENSCAVIERKEYGERLQFFVEDMDVGKPEMAGSKSLVGIPAESIREGTWQLYGFEQVVEIEMTFQPMENAAKRQPLPEETEPPPGPADESPDESLDEPADAEADEPADAEPEVKELDW